MVIAGIITSRAHLILTDIQYKLSEMGYNNKYSDTDSCCFEYDGIMTKSKMDIIVKDINDYIKPFRVESEGYNADTTILSLKRYISINIEGGKDKIKLHGKGRYNITQDDALKYVTNKEIPDKDLKMSQIGGNTERSLKFLISQAPQFDEYQHPFMFLKDIATDKTIEDFFLEWYNHIDTKTTIKEGCTSGDDVFQREIRHFSDEFDAGMFFGGYRDESDFDEITDYDYDEELEENFDIE